MSNKRTSLVAVVMAMLSAMTVSAQEKSCFSSRYAATQSCDVDVRFTKSDEIDLSRYLDTKEPIYSLSIDAVVRQPREASFTRVVLEDVEGRNWLVMECDRFRNDTSIVVLHGFCQETALLYGVTPKLLKCYVAGDAQLTISGVHVCASVTEPSKERDAAIQDERQAALRCEQVRDVVSRINIYNKRHGKLWRADVTDWALEKFGNSEDLGESDPYFANFKYYTEGIYEVGERQSMATANTSLYSDSFDWRFRHGRDTTYWVTPVKDQGSSGYCVAFAVAGATEAVTNLYYNRHWTLDLSEKYFITYSGYYDGHIGALQSIATDGIIDEASMPMSSTLTAADPKPYGITHVKAGGYQVWNKGNRSKEDWYDIIKYELIHNGPGIWGFGHKKEKFFEVEASEFLFHTMTLVGWGKVSANQYYAYVDDNDYYVSNSLQSTLMGQTYWIFKDSFGHRKDNIFQHGGYRYILFNNVETWMDAEFLRMPITRRGYSNNWIKVEDLDGDGYYNWGIGPRPDSRLPVWAEQEEDGDDSNPAIGRMTDYGFMEAADSISYLEIANDSIATSSWFQRVPIVIDAGKQLTIKGTVVCHPDAQIEMDYGSKLIIDRGKLVDPNFFIYSGAMPTLILRNGASIIFTSHRGSFSPPLGLKVQIESGNIMYDNNFW